METDETPTAEDFAQILKRLKDEYRVSDSDIARAIAVSVSTVNTWVHRKRVPRNEAITALHEAFPKFSREELSAAAGRKAPGPLSPDAEERILELYRGLTAEQQKMKEIEMRALRDANQS